jgi:hypothetical protein
MVNTVSVAQSYADIHRKLQKLEGFIGMNDTQLLEVANKVFVNWEHEGKWEANKRMKAKSFWLQHWGSQTQSSSQLHHGSGDQWEDPTLMRLMCLLQEDWPLEE